VALPLPEYDSLDGLALADLVRRREVSPAELIEAAIARVELRNELFNAVIHRMDERARRTAASPLPDGPFRGVPFLLKDLLAAFAGEPLSSGSRMYDGWRPDRNSELVNRFVRAGLVVVGKTNTPEFGLLPVTEPDRFGPTKNPWDRACTPGGSSGGSAAAVAARIVPMASGGDGGGSIRIPASCCGLFGLKPSRGRNPTGPGEGELWEGFATEHVITRTVRDSAAMLDATAGEDSGAPYFPPPPARPFLDEVGAPPGRLRIAMTVEPLLARSVHPDCRTAVLDAAGLLRELGHDVIEDAPPLDAAAFSRAMLTMLSGQIAADIRDAERRVGRRGTFRDFESVTWAMRSLGEAFTAGEYQSAVRVLERAARGIAAFTDRYDVWLTPTLGAPPVRIGELAQRGVMKLGERLTGRLHLGRFLKTTTLVDELAERTFEFVPYTPLANATGQPSMSVPLYWNREGLPVGVLFTARYAHEATLFRLAAQLETARPWKDRMPPGLPT
jgi:amidase